jgi:NADH:ubiquinone oxidoreductase subunit 2 (subunit N)
MTLKSYLWGVRGATFLALVGWGLVIIYIDPQKTGILGQFLFYLSAFFAASGIFMILLGWLRGKPNEENISQYRGLTLREGVLLSMLAISLLALQGFHALTWWDSLLAVAVVFLIELYFLSK